MSDGYYVGVPTPMLVYVGCPDRAEFDKIGVEAKDHGLDENGNHVITKTVEKDVLVIFQHWVAQETIDHMIARLKRRAGGK